MNLIRCARPRSSVGRFACLLLFVLLASPAEPAERRESNRGALSATEGGDEARFLAGARQLTFEGRRSGEGYFDPDGKALIFQSEREPGNPFYQIYILDLETGDSHRVSPGEGKTTCAFFRPGTDEVLFSSTHEDPDAGNKAKEEIEFRASGGKRRYAWDYDDRMDIYCARRDGTGLRRLTDAPGYDAEAAYSPDGSLIVFCSLRDAYPIEKLGAQDRERLELDPAYFGEIYVMAADGSGQRRLTSVPGYDGGPFFAPDGDRIVWRRFDPSGALADIYTMRTDGSDVRRLTTFGSMSWAPYFHPSGEYVIFASNKLGFSNFELFLVDALGTREPLRVTATDGFDGLPVFAPDGRRICWTSTRTPGGAAQLFLARWNHEAALEALRAQPPRIGPSGPPETEPSPSPVAVPGGGSMGGSTAGDPATAAAALLSPEICVADLRRHVEHLASDDLEGRLAGSPGARAASEYIRGRFQEAKALRPLEAGEGWFQEYEFTAGVRVLAEGNRLTVSRDNEEPREFSLDRDFRPLAFTSSGTVEGEVVFAGYGLAVPGGDAAGYDSYADLDVAGKIVLALRYVPEGVDSERRQELNRYAGLRYKVMIARERGARAILFVTGPNSPGAGALASLQFEAGVAGSGIVAASISGAAAEEILAKSGTTLKELQDGLDGEDPHAPGGRPIQGVRIKVATAVEPVRKQDRNVIGCLPPREGANEYVLVGAHYDHIGRGETGAMMRPGEESAVHNGADDNASGTAVVLELFASLADEHGRMPERFRRGLIFALWGGEEIGLAGSSHFAENPSVPLERIVAFLNFDMVGRLREEKLILQGVGSSPIWRRLAEKRNVAAGFALVLQEDPYLPTDVTALYPKGVPVLNFFTGGHEDYHRPTDDPETLEYGGMERIAEFARGVVLDLVGAPARPEYAKVERSAGGGSRENLRVYLGTIPDYAGQADGVKLTGVRPGGPAETGGLKAGDVIVEFGGQKVANIYDYTYALDAAKVGEPVRVVVLRDGERLELSVVPEVRK